MDLSQSNFKRKERPCDACRKRKSRCVVEPTSPVCVLCIFHGQNCTFLHDPQSRKRKIAQVGTHAHEENRRSSISSGKPKKSPKTKARVIQTTHGTGVEDYDDLTEPSLLKRTLGLQNQKHSQHVGGSRAIDPALLKSISVKNEIKLNNSTLRQVDAHHVFLVFPDPETQRYEEELDDLDAIETIVEPHGKALVDLYFRIVFPSFPILHKEVYLEKYGRSYREFSPPLLAAVYLLALHYWSYDDNLSGKSKPDTSALEQLARKALADTIHRPKLSTVQAGLLLLQHTDTDSAELTAQLVSVGYGLGLHLDASEWNIPHWEKGLRKRLGWGLYMQDKWSSLGSGRPSLITSSNWDLRQVEDADFPENSSHEDDKEGSSEVENGRKIFSHMISLSRILADILEALFTAKATKLIANAGSSALSIVLNKAKPVQLRLKEWFSNLPESLSMQDASIMKLSSVGYLRLSYIACEITLHRRILLALSPATNPQLEQICRSSAHERFVFAINFVQGLKAQHLSSFWYFASPQNFGLIGLFGTLLLSISPDKVDFYRSKLREYRWTLKINSENGAKYMKPAMFLLDDNLKLLEEAEKLKSAALIEGTSGTDHRNDDVWNSTSTILEEQQVRDGTCNNGDSVSPNSQFAFDVSLLSDANDMPSFNFSPTDTSDLQEFDLGTNVDTSLWDF